MAKEAERKRKSTAAQASTASKPAPASKPSDAKKSQDKSGGEVKREKSKESRVTRAPSESWNMIMPYLLYTVGALFLLLYAIVLIGTLSGGVGSAGAVGDFLHNLLRWTVGWSAYVAPVFLIIVGIRWRKVTAKGKTHGVLWTQFVVLTLLLSGILELLAGDSALTMQTYGTALSQFDVSAQTLPGGAVGGIMAVFLRWALRSVFATIVLIVAELFILMFFVGATPDVIFRYMKERHERNRERRAEYLREVEEARKAEAEAAEAERKAAAAAKAEEERLRKESEAAQRIRERAEREEQERIAAEKAEEARLEEERLANERAELERLAAEEAERERKEAERIAAEEAARKEEEERAEAERLAAEATRTAAEAAVSEAPVLRGPEVLGAPDFDYSLDEERAKRPKTPLPGDSELIIGEGHTARHASRTAAEQVNDPTLTEASAESAAAEEALRTDAPATDKPEGIPGDAETEPPLPPEPEYIYPPASLLAAGKASADISTYIDEIEAKKEELGETLKSFGIRFRNIEYSRGPTITRYEIQPEPGQRVKAIQNLMDDIALNMAVSGVRFEPVIPGKSAVGIEVPNDTRETVTLRSLVESDTFISEKSKLTACLGADITGKPVVFDVSKMPHLLVAGATGMGKSVCINSIIVSLMYKATPDELRLILIDPKKVEFAIYRDMPHLQTPIITDPQKAAGALCSAVTEMEKRFELIEHVGARDILGYKKVTAGDPGMPKMYHIVIIIDELADRMMTASNDVETAICRLAQKARAAGIHLIIGTQRPSVDVITGTIKANIPSRIACTVASQTDSRTILDAQGAEKLCGRGDMLFAPVGASRPRRVQGSFVSDEEVIRVVSFLINNNGTAVYDEQFMKNIDIEAERCMNSKKASAEAAMVAESDEDPKLNEAIEIAIEAGKISTSLLQRHLKVGYGRAASIIDYMEDLGIVSAADGNKPRKVLITMEEYIARKALQDGAGDTEQE
ncbi:MAG: hypothetical protein J6B77_01525 [Clostridia bacterium]|nr:hypothetical protein [Clostridia bacterium]